MSRVDAVGLAFQAAFGTAETTMEYFIPVETADVNENPTDLTIEETIGNRFATALDRGTRFFDVPMAGALRSASGTRLFSGFVCEPVTTGAGPYTHVMDPTVAGHAPQFHSAFAVRNDPIAVGQDPIVDLFYDMLGNQLDVTINANDYVKFNAAWIALNLDDGQAAPVVSADASAKLKFDQVVVSTSVDDGTTWVDLLAAAAGVTYQNNLDTDEAVLGSRSLYALPYGNADAQVTFTARSDMLSWYRAALIADPADLSVRLVATGATPDVFTALLASVQEITAPAPISGANVLKGVDVTARAHLDSLGAGPNAGKFFTATFVNAVATYA